MQTGPRRDDSEKATVTAAATTATTTTPGKTTRRYLKRGIGKTLPISGGFGKPEAGNGTPRATPIVRNLLVTDDVFDGPHGAKGGVGRFGEMGSGSLRRSHRFLNRSLRQCNIFLMEIRSTFSQATRINVRALLRYAPTLLIMTIFLPELARAQEGVVLLHGLCRTAKSMASMEAFLKKSGYIVVNSAYRSRTDSIEPLSEKAVGEALQSSALKECPQIHFVTHSLGGILVRSYFSRHFDPRLGRVVMLGPPNQGSEVVDKLGGWWAFKALNGRAGLELGTSDQSTPNRLGRVNFELGVVAGDRSINWINSLMIKGPDDGKVSVERTKVDGMKEQVVVHTTHPFMMKNRKVQRYTLHFLRTGSFQDRVATPAQTSRAGFVVVVPR